MSNKWSISEETLRAIKKNGLFCDMCEDELRRWLAFDAYEAVAALAEEKLKEYPEHMRYHFVCKIQIDDVEVIEECEYDCEDDVWVWANDWWEGERNIRLLGVLPFDLISIPSNIANGVLIW